MKKIIMISRGDISQSPTINNYLACFASLGYETHCISSLNSNKGVTSKNIRLHYIGFNKTSSLLKKIINYYLFGVNAIKKAKEIGISNETIFWVARIDTAICMGKKLSHYHTILSLHELHDKYPLWKYLTKRLIRNYKNVVYNELNRANIGRVWYRLHYTPSIIPNKPQNHPLQKNIKLKNEQLNSLILSLKETKKIILYQGSLLNDRNIEPLVKASLKFKENFVLVLMGKDSDGRIEDFKKINPDIVHIPWVTPPDHLYITSHAYIGVAFYDYDCLNSIYCAPNKIWEYSGFGIPMIGQNIPGLINTIGNSEAGLCVDIDNEEEIINAIRNIDENYSEFEIKSTEFYNSVDFKHLVKQALDRKH